MSAACSCIRAGESHCSCVSLSAAAMQHISRDPLQPGRLVVRWLQLVGHVALCLIMNGRLAAYDIAAVVQTAIAHVARVPARDDIQNLAPAESAVALERLVGHTSISIPRA